jgi:hypothetical protein
MGRPGAFGPIVSLFEKLIVTPEDRRAREEALVADSILSRRPIGRLEMQTAPSHSLAALCRSLM